MEYFFLFSFHKQKSCCSVTGFLASNEIKVKRKLNIAPFPWQHYLSPPNIINVKIPQSEITAVFSGVKRGCLPLLALLNSGLNRGMGNYQGQVLLSGDCLESRGRTSSSEQGQGSERSSARWGCGGHALSLSPAPTPVLEGKAQVRSVKSNQNFQGKAQVRAGKSSQNF